MGFVHTIVDYFLHLDKHLDQAARAMGPWFYVLLFGIVFCETGFVVTPFLPGDSLLFFLGALAATSTVIKLPLPLIALLLCLAANCGDMVNYFIGYKLGPRVFSRQDSWFLNRKHLLEAQGFYERYGRMTIIMARFVPIIRTFAPFVAGIGQMNFVRFALFSVTGGIFWVVLLLSAGYFFGQFSIVQKNFEIALLAVIFISILPPIIHYLRARKSPARGFEVADAAKS